MLTDSDLKKLAGVVDQKIDKSLEKFGAIVDQKIDKSLEKFGAIVDQKIDKSLEKFGVSVDKKLEMRLKPIKKDILEIRKDMKTIVNFFDREYLELRNRVERIEEYLKLTVS